MNTTQSTPHGARYYEIEPEPCCLPLKNWSIMHYFAANGDYLDSGAVHKDDIARVVQRDGVVPFASLSKSHNSDGGGGGADESPGI